MTVHRDFVLARPRPGDFAFQVWVDLTDNEVRNRRILERIRSAGLDAYLTKPDLDSMDQVTAAGMSFSGRLLPSLRPPGKPADAFPRIDIDGTRMRYPSGKPRPSLTDPAVLEWSLGEFGKSFETFKDHPAFMGVVLTDDDFSGVYGWDFARHVTERFEKQSGRRPPGKRPDRPPPGIVEDDDLWLVWNAFSLDEITGRFNRLQQERLEDLRPGTRVGPIPGPMIRPLVQMDRAAQYPPLNFGRHGFPLISFYYYNGFWTPLLSNTYWTEVARMGNRGLPVWIMPDCYQAGGVYFRNNAYHLLAGGVRGIAYFRDVECREPQWREAERLGRVISRIAPIQAALEPADRRVALLLSFTTSCFDPDHPHRAAYAYHYLMQAGYSVDVIAEEELLQGDASRYEAIVLHDIEWLRRSAAEALTAYARGGGAVLLDASVPFDLEGAARLGIDLGSGVPAGLGAGVGGGPTTYGKKDRIADVRRRMAAHVEPNFGAPDGRVVVSGFRVGETRYWWVVDTMDDGAFRFGYERNARRGDRDPLEAMRELWAWDEAELARGDRVVEIEGAPASAVVYDIFNGRQVPVTPAEGGGTLTLQLPRFGGALLAFLDEPVVRVDLDAPESARRGETVEFRVRLRGEDGPSGPHALDVALPVELELVDPDGRPYDGNRTLATKAGEVAFEWTPAINDLRGNWTLTVRQSASGRSARATLPLW